MKRLLPLILALGLLPPPAGAQSYDPLLTRADMVRLVMREHGLSESGAGRCFTDVREQEYAAAVCAAKREGLVTGDPSGRFRPTDHVTFVEAAAVIVRAEDTDVRSDAVWWRPYVETIEAWDGVPSSVKDYVRPITRSEVLFMLDAADGDDDDDDQEDDRDDADDDIRLQVTAADPRPEAGEAVTFRIRLQNLTDDDLDDVEVSAELDEDMDYVSSTEDGDEDDDTVEWEDLEIEDGETLTLLLNVLIDDDADEDDLLRLRVEAEGLRATASVRVAEDDEDDDDDDDGLEDIEISDSPDPVRPGDTITYRVELENGDDDVDATVRAYLNDDLHFVDADGDYERVGDTIVWDDVELDPDERRTFTFEVRVDDDVLDGQTVLMRVEAAGEEETETTEIDGEWDSGSEDVDAFVTDSPDPVRRGDQLTYRMTIENNEDEVIRVDARAFFDPSSTYLSGSNGASLYTTGEVRWNDVRIEENGSVELTLTLRAGVSAPSSLYLIFEAGDDDDAETTRVE